MTIAYHTSLAPVAVAELSAWARGIAWVTGAAPATRLRLELQREKVAQWEQMERAAVGTNNVRYRAGVAVALTPLPRSGKTTPGPCTTGDCLEWMRAAG